jgi:hypothetical protein
MESKNPALEWVLIIFALVLYVSYQAWWFWKTGFGAGGQGYGMNGKGKVARVLFSHLVGSSKV